MNSRVRSYELYILDRNTVETPRGVGMVLILLDGL
jgi:hypothetical protein